MKIPIRYDEYYIFCSEVTGEIYLYKTDPTVGKAFGFLMDKSLKWKKHPITGVNSLRLVLIDKYDRDDFDIDDHVEKVVTLSENQFWEAVKRAKARYSIGEAATPLDVKEEIFDRKGKKQ